MRFTIHIAAAKEGADDFCAVQTVNVFLIGYPHNFQLFTTLCFHFGSIDLSGH